MNQSIITTLMGNDCDHIVPLCSRSNDTSFKDWSLKADESLQSAVHRVLKQSFSACFGVMDLDIQQAYNLENTFTYTATICRNDTSYLSIRGVIQLSTYTYGEAYCVRTAFSLVWDYPSQN